MLSISVLLLPLITPSSDADLVQTVLTVPSRADRLALEDLDRDGDRDLLFVTRAGFAVHYMNGDLGYPTKPDALLPWPSDHLAWDLADTDGDGVIEICMLMGGRSVKTWTPGADGQFGEGTVLLDVTSQLPRGINRMRFLRDVDGDGSTDLVLPASGNYQIFLSTRDGKFAEPIRIAYDADVQYSVGDPTTVDSDFGQSVSVPWFTLEDFDGDDHVDLIARTEERISFHRADPDLAAEPTWFLDLEVLRDELPESDGVNLDDLFSNISQRVSWRIEDLDGEYPDDLILQLGASFRVFTGGSLAGPDATPDQILKSSGNVLYAFFRNVSGSDQIDLQIVRGERISLARVLRYLILPGSLDFDLFTYENEGGLFSRTPTRRNKMSLKIPRLLSLIDEGDEIEEKVKAQTRIPARRFALGADGVDNDVADIIDGEFKVFADCGAGDDRVHLTDLRSAGDVDDWIEALLLHDIDEMEDGGTKTLDLDHIDEWRLSPGSQLRAGCEGRDPVLRHTLAFEAEEPTLSVRDLDGDGRADFMLVGRVEDGFVLQILVRAAAK